MPGARRDRREDSPERAVIVALCPLDNIFDTAANVAAIDAQLERASAGGAALAVFPECALTGFKARKDLSHDHIGDALSQVRALAAKHRIAAFVPSTELDRSARPRNRARLFDARGVQCAAFEKQGLTRSEELWFAAGDTPRARTFDLGGLRFGVVFCIELNAASGRWFWEPVDAVLFPGYWGFADPFDWSTPGPHNGNATMRERARQWNAPLLQANTRRPEVDAPRGDQTVLGGSLAVAPDGRLMHPFEPHRRDPLFVTV
jgi:predicted amidohydrolase